MLLCTQVKRTEGVSSTDIVGRMLMLVRTNNRFSEVRLQLYARPNGAFLQGTCA